MPNTSTVYQNEHRWDIEAAVDLSAAGAVGAQRGTNCVWAKTGTGTYTCTVKGATSLKFVEILRAGAQLRATTLATVLSARVSTITQATDGSDDVIITVITAQTTGAAADTTAAVTLEIDVVLRMRPMGAW
jgi:predicted site-specific integrase-resolvase